MDEGSPLQNFEIFLNPTKNCYMPYLASKKNIALVHKSHIEYISSQGSKFNIHVGFHLLNKQLIGISFLKRNTRGYIWVKFCFRQQYALL